MDIGKKIDDHIVKLNRMVTDFWFNAANAFCLFEIKESTESIYINYLSNNESRPDKKSGMAKKLLCVALKHMKTVSDFETVELDSSPLPVDILITPMTQDKLNSYYEDLGFDRIDTGNPDENKFRANIDDLIENCTTNGRGGKRSKRYKRYKRTKRTKRYKRTKRSNPK